MKIIIIGSIAILAVILFLARKFRNRSRGWTRISVALCVTGILIALAFGPPKYVLMEDTLGVYRINGVSVTAYQGWEVNRLLPTEEFAVNVFYLPHSDTAIPVEQAGYQPLTSGFAIPGGILSRYLWSIMLLATAFCYLWYRIIRRWQKSGQDFRDALATGTIHAFAQFIETHDKGPLRPRRLLKQAHRQKSETCNRYLRRILMLDAVNRKKTDTLRSVLTAKETTPEDKKKISIAIRSRENYSVLLGIIAEAIRNVRDTGSFTFTHSISVEPGIYNTYFLKRFDNPTQLLQSNLETNIRTWNRIRETYGLPDMDTFLNISGLKPDDFSSVDSSRLNQIRSRLEETLKNTVSHSSAADHREWNELTGAAISYLFTSQLLTLPVEKKWREYTERYNASIRTILLEALSRFIPDETDEEGRPALFRQLPDRPDGRHIVVRLAYSGSVTTSGQVLCDQRFSFVQGEEVRLNRFGQRAQMQQASEQARPLLDAMSSCAQAFRSPDHGRAGQQKKATAEVSVLRRTLREIDDLISEYVRETGKEEVKNLVYEQLPDEFVAVAETLNLIVDIQMNSMAENGVELATSLLELLLTTEESD